MTDPSTTFVRAVRVDDLAIGEPHRVEIGEHGVCLVRVDEGIYAFDDVCPHRGAALSEGRLRGTTLTCAAHTWEFDVRTGELLRLRAPDCLTMREVRVVDGWIDVAA